MRNGLNSMAFILGSLLIGFAIVLVMGCEVVGKKGVAKEQINDEAQEIYSTETFTIKFPNGPADVKKDFKDGGKYIGKGTVHTKEFDIRSYEVGEFDFSDLKPGMEENSILKMGLNGWDKDRGTVMKEVTINGRNALDSVRTINMRTVSMTFREVIIWSPKDKKMYRLRVSGVKKEDVLTKEADEFVNSFKLKNE